VLGNKQTNRESHTYWHPIALEEGLLRISIFTNNLYISTKYIALESCSTDFFNRFWYFVTFLHLSFFKTKLVHHIPNFFSFFLFNTLIFFHNIDDAWQWSHLFLIQKTKFYSGYLLCSTRTQINLSHSPVSTSRPVIHLWLDENYCYIIKFTYNNKQIFSSKIRVCFYDFFPSSRCKYNFNSTCYMYIFLATTKNNFAQNNSIHII